MNSNVAYAKKGDIIKFPQIENNNNSRSPNRNSKNNTKAKKPSLLYRALKRLFDIIVSLIGMILLIPLTIIVKLMRIKNHESGKVFFKQLRIGKGNTKFYLYKFNTMIENADSYLDQYLKDNPKAKAEYAKYKKLKKDPRITKTGKFLRSTSLDEFPQFINVFKGEMSFVGPRPYLPKEVNEIDNFDEIIREKPGITGYWQTHGRSNTTFKQRIKCDKVYCKKMSVLFDIKMVIKTFINATKTLMHKLSDAV